MGLVLLIACANVATLFLARAAARKHETRDSHVGGSWGRHELCGRLLTESCLIALLGGAAGLLLAWSSTKALLAFAPTNLIPVEGVSMDVRVLAFTSVVALLTGVLFGTAPAVQAARMSPRDPLNEGGREGSGSLRRSRARSLFVVAEFALALVLLAGAGLLIRSLTRLMAVDPGFEREGRSHRKRTAAQRQVRQRRTPRRIQRATSFTVAAAAGESARPALTPSFHSQESSPEQVSMSKGGHRSRWRKGRWSISRWSEPQFFETMGIPVLQGRTFSEREGVELSHKVVISQAMAKQLWPNENPIGKHVTIYMKRGELAQRGHRSSWGCEARGSGCGDPPNGLLGVSGACVFLHDGSGAHGRRPAGAVYIAA